MEILSNQFTMKSLETDGQVYYISIIPFQQSESESKIALRIAKCQRQPFKEKASGVTFFPFSFKSHLKYYLEKFLSKEQKEEIIPTE